MVVESLTRQREIYINGFAGIPSDTPVLFRELEEMARKKLSARAYAYIAGGAGNESTLRANTQSFENLKIVPRMLRDVSVRDTSIDLFGKRLNSPLLLAPIGVLELAHPVADVGVAKAAAALNVPYIFSSQASRSMEDASAVMSDSMRWFQLYWSKSNELVKSFVQRAEKCKCSAIVVTLDTTMLGWRSRDLDMAYLPFLEGRGIAQYTSDPVFQQLMEKEEPQTKRKVSLHSIAGLIQMTKNYPGNNFFSKLSSGRPIKAVQKFISIYSNPALTWNDLKYLREITKLPVVLKGILHPDDARKAIDHGIDGIIVSNHGGRQVDGSISTIEALPAIADAVQQKIPVLIDSGIRGGADIFKALALGAKAVCIGRPYVYGLAVAGESGVKEVVQNMLADFELTMGLAGCKNIAEIEKDNIRS
ncbi:lactate 2-monooxygenase [Cytophagales bacterium WSM2-2]|nr:lactate 2-monooxygenase [Cytophagales bacterium WSM2-2]